MVWLEVIIKGKENLKKLFGITYGDDLKKNFVIDQIIGNKNYVVVTGSSSRKIGIFGSPNQDLISGIEIRGFEFCILLEWQNNKLSKLYLNDCSVLTHETVMKEWIDKI
mgnify:FL=1